jgi:hypothetical protein
VPDSHFLDLLLHLDITVNVNVTPASADTAVAPNVNPATVDSDSPDAPINLNPPVEPVEADITHMSGMYRFALDASCIFSN